MKTSLIAVLLLCLAAHTVGAAESASLDASGFVLLSDVAPGILQEMRYAMDHNFVGDVIDGYEEPCAIMTREAAVALKLVNDDLAARGLCLKVYDAYRPRRAVLHFVRWAKDASDTRMKAEFYPALDKSVLFKRGYISSRSAHSRGSTVDVTLYDVAEGRDADMGGSFDLFSERSHPSYKKITPEQYKNRMTLREAMIRRGFRPISTEWWHFTLEREPFARKTFDFPVAASSVR